MIILVTGCCGFIGFHLSEKLLLLGHEVHGLDSMDNYYDMSLKEINLKDLKEYKNFKFFKEDVRKTDIIKNNKPDFVYHLAGLAGVRNSLNNASLYFDVNVNGFINILDQCVSNKVKKIIYASSSSVYGLNKKIPFSEEDEIKKCNSPYACSKLTAENLARTYYQLYNLPSIGFRFFTVYGPRGRPDMAPRKFLNSIYNNQEITKYGDGKTFRDYTYISDIIDGLISSLNRKEKDCQIYNLGSGKATTLNKLIETCEKVTMKKAIIKQEVEQLGDVPKTLSNISKARRDLKYEPKVYLEEGLQKIIL